MERNNDHCGENPDKIETAPAKSPSKRGGWRPTIRKHSEQNDCVRQSLQSCCLVNNKAVLEKYMKSLTSDDKKGNIRALIYILDTLLANVCSNIEYLVVLYLLPKK